MKGLLIKDLKLLKTQRTLLFIILALCVLFIARGQEMSYVSAYLSAVCSMLVVSTISYDQMDNGMNFIFTFPISREKYVWSKYVFGILTAVCLTIFFIAGTAVMGAVSSVSYSSIECYIGVFAILLTAVVIMSFMIPLQLKFGAEKSRIAVLIFLGITMLAVYTARQAAKFLHMDLTPAAELLRQAGPLEIAVCLIVLMLGLLGISYTVSAAVMRRKQF